MRITKEIFSTSLIKKDVIKVRISLLFTILTYLLSTLLFNNNNLVTAINDCSYELHFPFENIRF